MRWPTRFLFGLSVALLIPIFLLVRKLDEIWDQYNVPAYIHSSIKHGILEQPQPLPGAIGDKIIVMAKLEEEDTSWVAEYLPEYLPLACSLIPTPTDHSSAGNALSTPLTHPHQP